MLNYVGVAVGGSRHETVTRALAALTPFSGKPEAAILGRREKLDILNASLVNGISSHIFDYDDTHLKTIIHPAGPVVSAALALAQHRKVSGADFLHAMLLGIETECRIGNAVWPSHYEMGWHITGSCGVFGSAAACGKLLGLNEQQMIWALGIAASQPVGLKVQFGSMTKSFHPGRAAQNGLTAALLAAQGFTADETALEGKDGFAPSRGARREMGEVTEGLGTRFEAALNTYKPFACGIVTHPAIDAAIQLRNENKLKPGDIASVELIANPLVLSLTGKTEPRTGLEGKFSIYHCIAVGLIYGAAGERQFQDAVVRDPARRRPAPQGDGASRSEGGRGAMHPGGEAEGRPHPHPPDRTCHRQPGKADERCGAGSQVHRPGRWHPGQGPGTARDGHVLVHRKGARCRRSGRRQPGITAL